jgi:hypothetical protein
MVVQHNHALVAQLLFIVQLGLILGSLCWVTEDAADYCAIFPGDSDEVAIMKAQDGRAKAHQRTPSS